MSVGSTATTTGKIRTITDSALSVLDHIGDGSESSNSWEAGVQTGYNFQFHCTVLGLQADWSWTDAKVDNFFTDTPLPGAGTFAYSSKENWFGTLRTRTGVVVDNLLLYVTGGLAWANFDRNHIYTNGFAPISQQVFDSSRTRLGFVVGAGTEWALERELEHQQRNPVYGIREGQSGLLVLDRRHLSRRRRIRRHPLSLRVQGHGMGRPHRRELPLRRLRPGRRQILI